MKDAKKQAIVKLVKAANGVNLSSIQVLNCIATALKAKERLDQEAKEKNSSAADTLKTG